MADMDEVRRSQVRLACPAAIRGALVHCPEEISVPVVVNHYLSCRCMTTSWLLCKAVSASRPCPKQATWHAYLTALQRLTSHGLKRVLLQAEQTLHVLKRHRCHGGRGLAASTLKAYVSSILAVYTSSAEAH